MSRHSFTLDLNRCTGCSACRLACTIENQIEPARAWRTVYTFNSTNDAAIGVHHLSLACNHCEQPSCLKACPAKAYRRDEETGAVLLDRELCLGCRYCSWVCPYGAPHWDAECGVMDKCTFCVDRLREGKDPACVAACPVDALGVEDWICRESEQNRCAGFPDTGIGPAIAICQRRSGVEPPRMSSKHGRLQSKARQPLPGLFQLVSEWSLLVFSLVAILLVGAFTSSVASGSSVWLIPFALAGIAALGISISHLGNPRNLLRAGLNLRTSWVSREIVLFSLFFWGAIGLAAVPSVHATARWVLAAVGIASLVAMDMVYQVRGQRIRAVPHSAMATLSFVLVIGVLTASWPLVFAAIGVKAILYGLRRVHGPREGWIMRSFLPIHRVGVGFVVPLVVWGVTAQLLHPMAILALVVGEVLDRAEFYAELQFLEPNLQIERDLKKT
ncbi:MAG: hypothetical protein GY906_17140 [bacterium]|nr:hypothetical protein [bacterium]